MLLNDTTALVGSQVLLVPYRASHVPRYHEWMSDPAVREATASEELSLLEEYEMQTSWRVDEDKLTFIVLSRLPDLELLPSDPTFFQQHGLDQMVGDVNIFLSKAYDSEEDGDSEAPASEGHTKAEVELMIALPESRRRGYGTAALRTFLSYASTTLDLPPCAFFARIGTTNEGSIALFEKLGFKRGKVVEAFGEVEMVWGGASTWGWEEAFEVASYPSEP